MGVFLILNTLITQGHFSKLFGRKGRTVTLERIEHKIDEMSEHVLEMETRLNYVDKSALMGIIYNPAIHVVDRLRAFVCYLKLGGNGLVAEYAERELVTPNRDDWTRAVQESTMKIHCGKYAERVAEINGRLR